MTPKWLTSLVRARQVQEEVAQAALADARRLGRTAEHFARREGDRLDALCATEVPEATAAFVAASVSLQAAAASHAAAVEFALAAQRTVDDRHAEFAGAARARLGAERLEEQHVARERETAARHEQLANDEIAGYRHLAARSETAQDDRS